MERSRSSAPFAPHACFVVAPHARPRPTPSRDSRRALPPASSRAERMRPRFKPALPRPSLPAARAMLARAGRSQSQHSERRARAAQCNDAGAHMCEGMLGVQASAAPHPGGWGRAPVGRAGRGSLAAWCREPRASSQGREVGGREHACWAAQCTQAAASAATWLGAGLQALGTRGAPGWARGAKRHAGAGSSQGTAQVNPASSLERRRGPGLGWEGLGLNAGIQKALLAMRRAAPGSAIQAAGCGLGAAAPPGETGALGQRSRRHQAAISSLGDCSNSGAPAIGSHVCWEQATRGSVGAYTGRQA